MEEGILFREEHYWINTETKNPGWFALRKFLITSTAAYNLVIWSDHYTNTEEESLQNCIGILSKEDDESKLIEQNLDMQFKSDKELLKLNGPELKLLYRKYGRVVSDNKEALAERIWSVPASFEKENSTLLENVCTNWFMKPL